MWCWRCSVESPRSTMQKKKGFSAQILDFFWVWMTQLWPSGAFAEEFADNYWKIRWKIKPAGQGPRAWRQKCENPGIMANILQNIERFGDLRGFLSHSQLKSLCVFLSGWDQPSKPQINSEKKIKIKANFPVCVLQQAPSSLPAHTQFI